MGNSQMGKVTEYLLGLIAKRVEDKGIVVWGNRGHSDKSTSPGDGRMSVATPIKYHLTGTG